MKNIFVNCSLDYLIRHDACSDKQVNIFRYTLESLYSLVTKTSVVLLLAFLLRTFSITCVALVLYSFLRGFAFGIHATKNIYCWIITLTTYILGPLFIQQFVFPMTFIYVSYAVGVLSILLWAPADTPSRPLLSKKKRNTNKMISFGLALLYIASSFYFKNATYFEIVSFVLLLESVCICPLTYALFGIPYRNYKTYRK